MKKVMKVQSHSLLIVWSLIGSELVMWHSHYTCCLRFFNISITRFFYCDVSVLHISRGDGSSQAQCRQACWACVCLPSSSISQLGKHSNIIVTFVIKPEQQRGLDAGVVARPAVFSSALHHAPSRVLLWLFQLVFFLLLNRSTSHIFSSFSSFSKGRIHWPSLCCEAHACGPRGWVSEWRTPPLLPPPPPLCIFTLASFRPGPRVNEDDFISAGKFDPICENHGQTARANDIIELMSYTPLSAAHSHGLPEAWRLSAPYTAYCMFDESLEGRIW